MASMGMLGFLGGASGQALEAMKSRQDEERDVRKVKMLEDLRRDTAIFMADYQEKLDAKKGDKNFSDFDPSSGEFVTRNSSGLEIGRRKDAGMAEQYALDRDKDKLGLDVQRANIRQSDASAANSYASAAHANRASKALDDEAVSKKPTLAERANELVFRNKVVVDDLVASGVPAEVVQRTATELLAKAAAEGRPASQAEVEFTKAAAFLRSKYKTKETSTNPSKAVRSLDQ